MKGHEATIWKNWPSGSTCRVDIGGVKKMQVLQYWSIRILEILPSVRATPIAIAWLELNTKLK